MTALRRAGHDVGLFAASTDKLERDPLYSMRSAARVATGRGRNPLDAVRAYEADVVHVHNLFPNFSRSWVWDIDVPLAHTLHNFRPFCAAGTLFRAGALCTECTAGRPLPAIRYGCYRNSRLATLPLALAMWRGPASDPVLRRADLIVALSHHQRRHLITAGVTSAKITVGHNFLPDRLVPETTESTERSERWLVVGRLGCEKGIIELLDRWPADEPLDVVGAGPLQDQAKRAARGKAVTLHGSLPRQDVLAKMTKAFGLVFPSLCYEVAPLVYLEALACGLPVFAFSPNSVAEGVSVDGTGLRASWHDDLAEQLRAARERFPSLRGACRAVFERNHTEGAFVGAALARYETLLEGA